MTERNYMTPDEKTGAFGARLEALAGIFRARYAAAKAEADAALARANAATSALDCARKIAEEGFARTAAAMLDNIASDGDAWMEFHNAEQEILRAIEAAQAQSEALDAEDSETARAFVEGREQGDAALGVGEVVS